MHVGKMPIEASGQVGRDGLVLTNLRKRYGAVVAVKGVSMTVLPGEVHALLGENGAGKSTLMNIASGNVWPDEGTISIAGHQISGKLTPAEAQRLGLAIVHQHPAIVPDLTVAENLLLAVPKDLRLGEGSRINWVRQQLKAVGCTVDPTLRMAEVGLAQCHMIELAKALAITPRILILDEPTAPLTADLVEVLFRKVNEAAERGAAIIYISHRLQEVRRIANRVTVMRDGEVKGSGNLADLSDDDLLRLIVGRQVEQVFPAKSSAGATTRVALSVTGLSGDQFHDVALNVKAGEIVGIAGISGNGQTEFLQALAGLTPARGEVLVGGKRMRLGNPEAAARSGVTYLSAERQRESLFMAMTIRENAAFSALPRFSRGGVMDNDKERETVAAQCRELRVRAQTIDANVSGLSGGNQQKVVMARAVLSEPAVILAEEPTAGVDVGARAEIYQILRRMSDAGTPILVVSSDLPELEGLCDRVYIFSRGHNVHELTGDEVTEEKMGRAMMTATSERKISGGAMGAGEGWGLRLKRFAGGDYAPILMLLVLVLALGGYVTSVNERFVSAFNLERILLLTSALALVGYGQLFTILTGGIDLAAGSLVGLVVVIASFFIIDGASPGLMMLGLVAMLGCAAASGAASGFLIRYGRFTAVAATLGMLVILQGFSVLLRPEPGGIIQADVIALLQASFGGLPAIFALVVLVGILLELALRYSSWGMSIRAAGSAEHAAARIGVRINTVVIWAYILCAVFTALGGIMVMAQLGIGDPNQGGSYTLTSIAAVVLGGASLFGGRGSFLGVVLGALLIQIINSSTLFLGLSGAWQYWFIGGITLAAVAVYSRVRA